MLVFAAATAALSSLGCGSDSDGGSNNGGGSNGGGASNNGGSGGSAITQCVANNAEFTRAEFVAQTEQGYACSAESDASTVCASNMPLIGGTCGKGCLGMGTDAEQADCVAACINDALITAKSEPLSDECMACYTADVECARKNCLTQCGLAPTSETCATCRTEKGCAAAFYECSGFPEPAGAGGEGGS
jgi:hypothetical protein